MESLQTLNRSEIIEILRNPSNFSIDRVSTALSLVLKLTRESDHVPSGATESQNQFTLIQ